MRKNLQPIAYAAEVQPAPCLRVLLVTARPAGVRDVSYRTISRPLVRGAGDGAASPPRSTSCAPAHSKPCARSWKTSTTSTATATITSSTWTCTARCSPTTSTSPPNPTQRPDLPLSSSAATASAVSSPTTGLQAFLFFDDDEDGQDGGHGNPVSAEDLANLLTMRQIPIVVLNACQSGKQVGASETSLGARLLDAGAQMVVAMGYSVTVSAATRLMTELYTQLLDGKPPATAVRRGRLELFHEKTRRAAFGHEIELEDWPLPVIYQNRPVDLRRRAHSRPRPRPRPPRTGRRGTTYGFFGRDVDILQLERRLLAHNVLLVRGMGGAGKTTLLHHVGWWWQKTGFVEQRILLRLRRSAPTTWPRIVQAIGAAVGPAPDGPRGRRPRRGACTR